MKSFLSVLRTLLVDVCILWPVMVIAVALNIPDLSEGLGNILMFFVWVMFVIGVLAVATIQLGLVAKMHNLPTKPVPHWKARYWTMTTSAEVSFFIYHGWFITGIMWLLASIMMAFWRSEAYNIYLENQDNKEKQDEETSDTESTTSSNA